MLIARSRFPALAVVVVRSLVGVGGGRRKLGRVGNRVAMWTREEPAGAVVHLGWDCLRTHARRNTSYQDIGRGDGEPPPRTNPTGGIDCSKIEPARGLGGSGLQTVVGPCPSRPLPSRLPTSRLAGPGGQTYRGYAGVGHGKALHVRTGQTHVRHEKGSGRRRRGIGISFFCSITVFVC